MAPVLEIKIAQSYSDSLHLRELAKNIVDMIEESGYSKIDLNFEGVDYISRSFADQFHKERQRILQSKEIHFSISNANEEVITMLRIVESTQNQSKRKYVRLPIIKYSDKDLLSDYLLSI